MINMEPEERVAVSGEIAGRLRELLGDRDAGNGTPLAAAVACAMMEDIRAAGIGAAAARALADQALVDAAENLHRHLHKVSRGFALPFGTMVESPHVEIAGRRLALDARRPGLQPLAAMGQDVDGPNLELLLALLAERMPRSRFPALGLPRAVVVDGLPEEPGLEFPPIAEVAGVTLRHSVSGHADPFCSLLAGEVVDLADDIVHSVDRLWHERDVVGRRVGQVRRAVLARIAGKYDPSGPVSLRSIAIDYTRDQNDDAPYLYIEYNALDHALRPGPVIQDLHGRTRLNSRAFYIDDSYRYRAKLRAELEAIGARGRVEQIAADLIRAAPEGEKAVLERLGRDLETHISIPHPGGDLHGRLWWSSGTVHATFDVADKIMTSLGGVEWRAALPDAVMTAAAGRLLDEVAELPFPCDCRIRKVERINRADEVWTKFVLDETTCIIDVATGTIWP